MIARSRLLRRLAKAARPALRSGLRALGELERRTSEAPTSIAPRPRFDPPARAPTPAGRRLPIHAPRPAPAPRGFSDRPRIVLLNPPRYRGIAVFRMFRSEYLFVQGNHVPPMDLAYFAAAAKDRAEVTLIDAHGEDLSDAQALARIEAARPDVIVVRGVLDILEHELALALRYAARRSHVRVVLACRGAIGAEAAIFAEMPRLSGIARGEIDAFAEDLADGVALEAIEGMATPGRVPETIRVVEDLDRHPIPDVDALPPLFGRGYTLPYYGVESGYFLNASRGCPYACTFCMVGGVDGRPFRMRKRDPENVVEELRMLERRFGIRDLYVFDEIFTCAHGQRVSEAIARAGLAPRWRCEGKPDLVTRPMLRAMRAGGCRGIFFGVESGDDAILADVHKGHTVDDARRALAMAREEGIETAAYVMLGFPEESWRTFLRLVRFLDETRPDLVRYGFLAPYPVTALHRQMRSAGLLELERRAIDRRISPLHDARVRLRTKHLGPRALEALDFVFKQAFADELQTAPRRG